MIKLVDLLREEFDPIKNEVTTQVATFMGDRIKARLDKLEEDPVSLVSYLWFVEPVLTMIDKDLVKDLRYTKREDRIQGTMKLLQLYNEDSQQVYKTLLQYLSTQMGREIENWFEDDWSEEEKNTYERKIKPGLESSLLNDYVDQIDDAFEILSKKVK